jgi:putative hydrolase of the HAD superfamily
MSGASSPDRDRPAPSRLDAVIFDWGGTLTPWHDIEALQSWAAAVGDAALAARLFEAENAAWLRSRDEQVSARLAEIFAAAELEATEEMLRAYHDWWEPHTHLDPAAPALFAALRDRGLRVGVLSNTVWPRAEHERIFARDGVLELIDAAVYTSELPWTKPHPEAFRAAMAAVGAAEPARCVFVGDRVFDDIHGAKAVGMRAVLVPHSNIPPEQHGHTAGEPDAVIHELGELLAVIDRWR